MDMHAFYSAIISLTGTLNGRIDGCLKSVGYGHVLVVTFYLAGGAAFLSLRDGQKNLQKELVTLSSDIAKLSKRIKD